MANHISHAALPYPVRNARFTVLVPLLDADGDPTDPTTPDTEVSLDGAAAADAAEEMGTITGMAGLNVLTLTGAETNGSAIGVACKAASGPKTTLLTLYPKVLPVLFSGTASAGAAGSITLPTSVPRVADLFVGAIIKTTGGTGGGGTGGANNQARVITGFTSAGVASVTPNWETTPDNTTTFELLATPEWAARLSMLSLTQVFDTLTQLGVVSYGTLAAGGGVGSGTFPSGQRANVKVGDILVVPSIGRTIIATVDNSTGAYTNSPNLASDPSSTAYFVLAAPAKQVLDDADFASGKSITSVLNQSLSTTALARIEAAQGEAIGGTVSTGSHTSTLIAASSVTGLGNDQMIGRALLGKTGNIAGLLMKVTDYDSSTGAFSVTLLNDAALPVAPANGDTFELPI